MSDLIKPLDDHIGPWSDRVPRCSRDELHMDVLVTATMHGFELTGAEQTRLEQHRRGLDTGPMGSNRLPPAAAADLQDMAERGLAWLNQHAPAGKRFWMTDGMYLLPVDMGEEYASVEAWPRVRRRDHWPRLGHAAS